MFLRGRAAGVRCARCPARVAGRISSRTPYQPAFRISREVRAERQRAKRRNPVHVYKMDSKLGRRCVECGCKYGDEHGPPCVPDPHIP
jgi:hypothetical protein